MNAVWIALAGVAGAAIGSFLNVVAHRGPRLWGLVGESDGAETLSHPRSYCPACRAPIRRFDLIPLASFLILRGKCRTCGAAIPPRYLIVEAAGAVSGALAIVLYGPTLDALFASLFLFALITLTTIDLETGFLPDAITIPLVWLGLIANLGDRFASLSASVIGAVAGYLSLRLIADLYRLARRREGLGLGDAKLLAAIGAWGGWTILAPTVFAGALVALCGVAIARLFGRRFQSDSPIAFGPALCVAGGALFIFTTTGRMDFFG
ncbi:MAG TPA: A24 family peptidase [Parvularculaceae bacterium]|nr:A24 family peptidase [Parvularculaceae bacterium]